MHLYRSVPKGGTNYKFPEGDFTLTPDHNDSLIRINVSLTITIPADLPHDFYCQIKVFANITVRIEYEVGANVEAQEGFFIEGGQTFTIMGNGVEFDKTFTIVRNRPVVVEGFNKILETSENPIPSSWRTVGNGKYRLMKGGVLVYETVNAWDRIRDEAANTYGYPNPNNDLITMYAENTRITGSGALHGSLNYTENIDYSSIGRVYLSGAVTDVSAISGVPTLDLLFSTDLDPDDAYNIMLNFQGVKLGASNSYMAISQIDLSSALNLETFMFTNGFSLANVLNIDNCPNLTTIQHRQVSGSAGGCIGFSITNTPLLNSVHIVNYGIKPNTNVDQLFIDLDTNGLSNGLVHISAEFVTTAASDAARTSLIGKGWVIKRDYFGNVIES